MKIKKVDMVVSAVSRKQYPGEGLPEIAFAGRSNVGKSSLINSILNRKGVARVSSQPGKTRTINFYRVNDGFFLVDLPGYGFAKTSRAEQLRWGKMMNEYLNTRTTLHGVLQLVDIRHKPTRLDIMMFNWIKEAGYPGVVVATKSDKISRAKRTAYLKEIIETLKMGENDMIITYSSQNNEGREEVWYVIDQLCGFDPEN